MAITANVNSSTGFAPSGCTRLANCAVTPIPVFTRTSLRYLYQGPGRPGPGRPKTYDGKVHWDDLSRFEWVQSEDDDIILYHQVLNHVHLRRNPGSKPAPYLIRGSGAGSASRACGGYPHPAAGGAVQHRYRLGCADALSWVQSTLPDRVSLQRRQAVYVSECLSSALAGQAAFSLQCQYERSDLGQTGSAAAKRRCPGRVFHGESQTARLQPTSAGANFSVFSPGA